MIRYVFAFVFVVVFVFVFVFVFVVAFVHLHEHAVTLCDWRLRRHDATIEPPVGFEPTTSRLLSGCSAN